MRGLGFTIWGSRFFREAWWIVLLPAALIWSLAAFARQYLYFRDKEDRSGVFVLCYGNIHSGGSGKTPLVMETIKRFGAKTVGVIARGYRGKIVSSEELLRASAEGSIRYGDEAWMISQMTAARIWVGPKRTQSLKAFSVVESARLAVCDDGMQNPTFRKDLSVGVLSASRSPEQYFLLPLGEGRANLSSLRKCDAFVITARTDQSCDQWGQFLTAYCPDIPTFIARRKVLGFFSGAEPFKGSLTTALGFCGVDSPELFLHDLRSIIPSARLIGRFPNHHSYNQNNVDWLQEQATVNRVTHLVTTDKDWYKMQPLAKSFTSVVLSLRIYYDLSEDYWKWVQARAQI